MTVEYVILQYNKLTFNKSLSDEERIKIIKNIVKPIEYINFNQKRQLIKNLLKETISIKDNRIIYDSCDKYYNFIITMLKTYTKIDITDITYDKLCSTFLLNYIIASFQSEYDICGSIMDSMITDLEKGRIDLWE